MWVTDGIDCISTEMKSNTKFGFLGHMRLLGLKDTLLSETPPGADDEDVANKNEEAYAELIQYLDDKSLSLVMRYAADDGRKALQILRAYYAGKGKP
ncbi:hypothetical protein QQF64_025520 [Cirrhinus molitorella]|uniref:Uncharacterized protein n=1 Tax=Cirrhinus molitorella TaxID=172907 RepID=A0ABR3NQ52_9TELE